MAWNDDLSGLLVLVWADKFSGISFDTAELGRRLDERIAAMQSLGLAWSADVWKLWFRPRTFPCNRYCTRRCMSKNVPPDRLGQPHRQRRVVDSLGYLPHALVFVGCAPWPACANNMVKTELSFTGAGGPQRGSYRLVAAVGQHGIAFAAWCGVSSGTARRPASPPSAPLSWRGAGRLVARGTACV